MAVQQNKKSPSKRGMHRSHDFLVNPPTAIEPTPKSAQRNGQGRRRDRHTFCFEDFESAVFSIRTGAK